MLWIVLTLALLALLGVGLWLLGLPDARRRDLEEE